MDGIQVEDFEEIDLNSTTYGKFASELAGETEKFSNSFISNQNDRTTNSIGKEPDFDATHVEDFSQISRVSSFFGGIAGHSNNADSDLSFSDSNWLFEFFGDEQLQDTFSSIMESLKPVLNDTSQTLGSRKNVTNSKGNKRNINETFSEVNKSNENENEVKGKDIAAPTASNNKITPNEETTQKNPKRRKIIPKQEKVSLSFSCNISSKYFPRKNKSILHKQMHKNTSSSDPCVMCGKTFRWRSQRKFHEYTHMTWNQLQRTRVFHAKCYFCNDHKIFHVYRNYERHLNTHTQETPYSCNTCSKRFAQASDLKRHELVHSKEKRFKCQKCGKRFTLSQTLKIHDLVHMDKSAREKIERSWKYECEFCKKKFRSPAQLNEHTSTHTGQKKFTCSYCDQTFARKGRKTNHEKSKH